MNLAVYQPEDELPEKITPANESVVDNVVSFGAPSKAPEDPQYMTVEEVCEILGETREDVMRAIYKGGVPAVEIGDDEWRVFRNLFEENRFIIGAYVKNKTEIEGLPMPTSDE